MTGILKIERVVGIFEVWLDASLIPHPRMRVKVLERADDFLAISNMERIDPGTGRESGVVGHGETAEEALDELLRKFVADARDNCPANGYTQDQFAWTDPIDFF